MSPTQTKKVRIYPNIKKNKFWQIEADPSSRKIAETYAFLANSNTFRPHYDNEAQRFQLGPVNSRYTDEQINDLARRLAFNDDATGKKISSSDPTDRRDPFFTHNKCKAKISRDIQVLDLNRPLDELVYGIMSADPLTIIGENALSQLPNAEFIIEDAEADAIVRESKRERTSKLHSRFEALTGTQRKNMATAMGIKFTGEEPQAVIDDMLYTKITENSSKEVLTSLQDLFIELSDPKNKAKLELTVTVERLFQYAILRKESTRVLFNGEPLNTDTIHLVEFLSKPENSGLFLTLEEALKAKMK